MPVRFHRARPVVSAVASLLLLLVVATAWLGFRALEARRHLESARDSLQAARAALLDQDVQGARLAIDAAAADTGRARAVTGALLWRVASGVPVAGRSLEVVRGLSAAADDVAVRVLPPALEAAQDVDPADLRGTDGAIALPPLVAAREPVTRAASAAGEVRRRLVALPGGLLLPPVASARVELLQETGRLVDALDGARTALEVAPALLGADRPRRFFVLIQQTSESRGTGGLPGGFAVLETDRGRVRVTAQGANADLTGGEIPPPDGVPQDYVDLYRDLGAFALSVNVNLSPDLPVVARVVAARWAEQSGQAVDGVIALDAIALQSILSGSGPIPVPGGKQLAPEQIVQYLAVQQYVDFAPPTGSSGIDRSAERKELLRRISRAATGRLTGGGGDDTALVRGLLEAVRSGHLRVASDDPVLRAPLEAAGVTGALPSGAAPVAYPVVFNSTGGKLDHFLDRSVRYEAGPCTGPRRRSSITVDLRNAVPNGGLPPYLTTRIEGGVVGSSLSNSVTLQVYGTRGAVLERARLDGEPLTATFGQGPVLRQVSEAGLPVWSVLLELPKDKTRRLVLDLVEPVVPGAARVPEQPLARPLLRTVDVPTC